MRWLNGDPALVSARFGSGAAHRNRVGRSRLARSSRGCTITAEGAGLSAHKLLPVRRRRVASGLCQRVISGASDEWPVRRQVHPLLALPPGRTWADQTPCDAVACHSPHELMCGPGRARLSPRASYFCPAGLARQKRPAASEKAPGRIVPIGGKGLQQALGVGVHVAVD
jgi:hypothetical protein